MALSRSWHAVARLGALLLVLAVDPVSAQVAAPPQAGRETTAASVANYALSATMPVDPEVLVGTLPNGLRYYVRPNGRPAKQAELRLVVKAGSVLETDEQRGLAHFVEHMQFEGSRHFPGQGINEFLASLGLSLGGDANAQTGFDDTQYSLRVPTDDPAVLDVALTVLEDWAGGATFEPAGIERQRPIVLAEWRRNLGADERTDGKIRRVQLEGSRYADRTPIGVPEVIRTATREQLLAFYRDWYRPNLMAVIVVGDVDRQMVERMIRQHFAGLENPPTAPARPVYDVPERPGTRYAVVSDSENTGTLLRISDLRPARSQGTVGGYRAIMKDQLFSQMLGDRLDELSQAADPPFLRAAAGRSLFAAPRTRDEAVLQALVANDRIAPGLDALITELQRVVRHGFTPSELDRAKAANMAGSERVVQESPDRESESRADEYTRNFLQDEALPTIWQELAFHRRFLPEITLAEMNELAADWFPDGNRLVVVSAPDTAGIALPTEAQLATVVATATAKRLEAYVDPTAGQSLMAKPPAAGTITKTSTIAAPGITVWTLSNGATVVLRPTTLKTDQILFRAVAPGGTSLASDDDFPSARAADDVIPAGGVGSLSGVVLDRLTSSKAVAVQPFINETRQGMAGGSAPQDMETMFQLLHLRFTQPRADQAAFAAIRGQAQAMLANRLASPDAVFGQTLEAALSSSLRRQSETTDTVAKWRLDTALSFYKARFADASNFTFIFVGSFTLETIKPLVETYVASLPATHAAETWRDVGAAPPVGIVRKTVEKGIAPKSQVAIVFSGKFDYSEANRLALRTATLVLQSRLNDAIREELGATYSITAESTATRVPRPEYRLHIDWTCDPEQVDKVVQRVFTEIAATRDEPLTPQQMGRVRDILHRDTDRNRLENGYLLNEIARRLENGDMASLAEVDSQSEIDALDAAAVQRAATAALDLNNFVQVTLVPEKR